MSRPSLIQHAKLPIREFREPPFYCAQIEDILPMYGAYATVSFGRSNARMEPKRNAVSQVTLRRREVRAIH
ncbi:hypothetical protein M514_12633 [Trichuris suis]|uniref:Uncharacterized protein n=1 Tax=Trichuris suis TaxID=68888 RepID=A0A085MU59_9BILA|nr:hypothetical protein M513_12633 [Trichuris suis]KFD60755.1 hypothetical protein M514_12633 [Trichuris suis]